MVHKKIRIPRESANEILLALGSLENALEFGLIRRINYFSCIKKEFYDWKLQNEIGSQKSILFEIILASQ